MNGKHEIVGCVLLTASPFGKRESFTSKALATLKIFGPIFFLRYGGQYIYSKMLKGNGVARILDYNNVPCLALEKSINSPEVLEKIGAFGAEALISIGGNQIFKRPLLDLTPKGCVNLHTAALPKYRGLMPTFWALKNREKQIGVSVFLVDEGIDTGPILSQKMVDVANLSQSELITHTKDIGMSCIVEALDELEKDEPQLMPNEDTVATYYGFPTRKDVREFLAAGARFF